MNVLASLATLFITVSGLLLILGARRHAGIAFGSAVLLLLVGSADMRLVAMLRATTFEPQHVPIWAIFVALPIAALFGVLLAIRILQSVLAGMRRTIPPGSSATAIPPPRFSTSSSLSAFISAAAPSSLPS